MGTDVSGFQVVYKARVLRALSIQFIEFDKDWKPEIGKPDVPKFIEILAINEDGNVVALRDEAWMFQFIPSLNR